MTSDKTMTRDKAITRDSEKGHPLYVAFAGFGVLVFFLGPALSLLTGIDPLLAASIGYAGIACFVGGVAARYSFAFGANPLVQLLKNFGVGVSVTGIFYVIFLLIYLL
jgi:hypothetical protein